MNQSAGCASFASTSNPGWSTRDECASSLGSKPPKSSTRCSNTAPLVRRAPPTALVLRRRARTGSTTPPRTRAVCPEPTDRREPPALAPRLPTPPGSPPFSPHSGTLQASTPTAPPPIGSRRIERAERTRSEHRISTTILYRHRRSAGYTFYPPRPPSAWCGFRRPKGLPPPRFTTGAVSEPEPASRVLPFWRIRSPPLWCRRE